MADLDACYSCGAPDDVGEYAAIPDRYAREETDQRRVVLCSDCRRKLTRVVRPLADRPDEAVGDGPPGDDPGVGAGETAAGSDDGHETGDGTDEDGGPGRDGADEAGGGDADAPDRYRTVLGLLSNRRFPVEREAVAVVARDAYDLTDAELDAVSSHAVDVGDLVVDDGEICRP